METECKVGRGGSDGEKEQDHQRRNNNELLIDKIRKVE